MEILLLEIPYKFKRKFYFQAFIYYVHEFVETPKRGGGGEGGQTILKKKIKIKITQITKIKMENFV